MDMSRTLSTTDLCMKNEYLSRDHCSEKTDGANVKEKLIQEDLFKNALYSELSEAAEGNKVIKSKYGGKPTDNKKISKVSSKQLNCGEAHKKPAYSYVALIATVLQECPKKKMTLSEIYFAISTRWPFYKNTKSSQWQNSIRHNLSLNDCFQKVAKEGSGNKKGNYWMLAPTCKFADMFEPGQMQRRKRQRRSYDRSRGLGGIPSYTRNRASSRVLSYAPQASTWPLYQDMSTAIDTNYQGTYGNYNYSYPAITSDFYSQIMAKTASHHLPNPSNQMYHSTTTIPVSLTETSYQSQLLSPDTSYSTNTMYDQRLLLQQQQEQSYYSPPQQQQKSPTQYQSELINSIYTNYPSGEYHSMRSNYSWLASQIDHTSDGDYDALTDQYTSCMQTVPATSSETSSDAPLTHTNYLPNGFVGKAYNTESYSSQEQLYNTLSMLKQPADSHSSYQLDEYSSVELLNRYREEMTCSDDTPYSSSNAVLLQQHDDVINVE